MSIFAELMKKATWYLIKSMFGPFLGGVSTIMFIFLLQFLMRSLDKLVGKGLSIWVIMELIALNLAWMLVLAVPMGVLIATLMVFGRMSGEHEITAFKAAGINPLKLMLPAAIAGLVIAVTMVWFNDDVLPDANFKAKTLFRDIRNKKPTFNIEPGVFSDLLSGYSILAKKTDPHSGDLFDVTIFDHSDPVKQQVITAKHGIFQNSSDNRYLVMTLNNGEVHEMDNINYDQYKKVKFTTQKVLFDATGFGFERSNEGSYSRGNREMSVETMQIAVDSLNKLVEQSTGRLVSRINESYKSAVDENPKDLLKKNKLATEKLDESFSFRPPMNSYANTEGRLRRTVPNQFSKKIEQNETFSPETDSISYLLAGLSFEAKNAIVIRAQNDQVRLKNIIDSEIISQKSLEEDINNFLVEIHKKYALPVACLVFIFVGVPLGIMSKKGGIGVGAGLSLAFFLIYWIFLLGGEKLADRGLAIPSVAMWSANVVIMMVGIWLTVKMLFETPIFEATFIKRWFQRRKTHQINS